MRPSYYAMVAFGLAVAVGITVFIYPSYFVEYKMVWAGMGGFSVCFFLLLLIPAEEGKRPNPENQKHRLFLATVSAAWSAPHLTQIFTPDWVWMIIFSQVVAWVMVFCLLGMGVLWLMPQAAREEEV